MQQIIIFLHIIIAIAIISLVLLQQGKGANMGAAFGSGASNTVFGSRGPASFLMKLTGGMLLLFFITSLTLGYLSAQNVKSANQLLIPQTSQNTVPPVPNIPAQK
jgi:preprotein translocase subunit SecG